MERAAAKEITKRAGVVSKAWSAMVAKVGSGLLSPIKNDRDLEERTELLFSIDAEIEKSGIKHHPLSALSDLLTSLIEEYEDSHFPMGESSPREALRYLMDAQGVRQKDLSDIISQGNLSCVLSGKRNLTIEQVSKLARRFHVEPSVFID